MLYNNDSLTLYTIGGSVITVETLLTWCYITMTLTLYDIGGSVITVETLLTWCYITMTLSLYILLVVQS